MLGLTFPRVFFRLSLESFGSIDPPLFPGDFGAVRVILRLAGMFNPQPSNIFLVSFESIGLEEGFELGVASVRLGPASAIIFPGLFVEITCSVVNFRGDFVYFA